jgi:hypothetical protein
MNFCDWFFSFMTHLFCSMVGLILVVFALLLIWVLWYLAPWLIVGFVTVILAFLFVPPLRRWQDEYTPGWDWTRRKR